MERRARGAAGCWRERVSRDRVAESKTRLSGERVELRRLAISKTRGSISTAPPPFFLPFVFPSSFLLHTRRLLLHTGSGVPGTLWMAARREPFFLFSSHFLFLFSFFFSTSSVKENKKERKVCNHKFSTLKRKKEKCESK